MRSSPGCSPATGTTRCRSTRRACAAWSPTTWPRPSRSARPTRWSASQERAILLRRLGEAMSEQPEAFGEDGRPSGLFDTMVSPLGPEVPPTADVTAHDILSEILMTLSGIWPAGNSHRRRVPLGDCWRHAAVRGEGLSRRLGALPQAVAVADLFAARALRLVRRARARPGRTHGPARIPQRRPADRQRRAAPAR